MKRIHVFGASGSGASTLGAALAETLSIFPFDADDFYWERTDPPYTQKAPPEERQRRLLSAMEGRSGWVLSGSLDSWGDPFLPLFELVIFLDVPAPIRLERLRNREQARHGARVLPGGDMHAASREFLEWAAHYDDGTRGGRSRARHEAWLERLTCPLLRIDGALPRAAVLDVALQRIRGA